jgi:hypothetical protein
MEYEESDHEDEIDIGEELTENVFVKTKRKREPSPESHAESENGSSEFWKRCYFLMFFLLSFFCKDQKTNNVIIE